jgi:hypothetical protein
MTNTINTTKVLVATCALALITLLSVPSFASAASYAYVASTGEVKSVTATDWMLAIATAPGIHINSGVFMLKSAADFAVIGEDIIVSK